MKHTVLSRFFASTYGKTIRGLAFFCGVINQCQEATFIPDAYGTDRPGRSIGDTENAPNRPRKKPLFQKLRKHKETSRDVRKGARIETRLRSSSMTP